jgi:hypothetical protein
MLTRRRSVCWLVQVIALGCAAAIVAAPVAAARLVPSAGAWPAPVIGEVNPLIGSPYVFNGAQATANARLRIRLSAGGRARVAITRPVGDRTVVRGDLRNSDTRRAISGATVTLIAEDVHIGQWVAIGNARTSRRGRFRAVLPVTARHLRVAVVYYPAVTSTVPVYSRRVLVRSSARVWLGRPHRMRRTVRVHGRVSGGPVPADGLLVALQVGNGFGRWVTVRLARTRSDGRFRLAYRFPRSSRLIVRVRVPGSQPGWALYAGASPPIPIRLP